MKLLNVSSLHAFQPINSNHHDYIDILCSSTRKKTKIKRVMHSPL